MLRPVLLQILVHPVGDPEQRQLAQRREVARAEVVGQGGVHLVRLVDVPVRHAPTDRLWRHVDELDLIGTPDDLVGHRLALPHTRYRVDDITERLQMLDVHRRDHIDPGFQQLLDVLPALAVARTGHVGVRQLVDQRHGRLAFQDRVHVHFGENRAAVLQLPALNLLQAVQHDLGAGPAVVLDERHHGVRTPLHAPVRLGQHRVRLTDARCRAEIDP